MKIVFKDTFLNRFEKQIAYIAKDSPANARTFKNDIIDRIKEIPQNPFLYRKSIYFDMVDVRDLIFKGYRVVFRITPH
ncbi:MAG: type II toxin-antitoxin system RelE/ParE family toxin [Bacteroidota bacterium]